MLFLTWHAVVAGVVLANITCAIFIRYRHVNVGAASDGVLLVRLKWIICPSMGYYFYSQGDTVTALIALFWPLLIFPLGIFTPVEAGRIQNMFMEKLGYSRRTP